MGRNTGGRRWQGHDRFIVGAFQNVTNLHTLHLFLSLFRILNNKLLSLSRSLSIHSIMLSNNQIISNDMSANHSVVASTERLIIRLIDLSDRGKLWVFIFPDRPFLERITVHTTRLLIVSLYLGCR